MSPCCGLGETRNVNNNGFSMSDPTREMRKNPREKTHYHKTLSASGTTAIVKTNAFNN